MGKSLTPDIRRAAARAHASHGGWRRKQRGAVLFIALIALVALTLTGLSLMRSVDTANLIAGNFAFKQTTLQATDVGVEAAAAALPTITTTSLDANLTPAASSTSPNYWYYATMRELDANGVPTIKEMGGTGTATAIDWSAIPVAAIVDGKSIQFVVDRLCQGPAPVTDIQGKCYADVLVGGGSKKAGGVVFSTTQAVYYRVTVRVAGLRGTVSMAQTILSR